MGTRFRPWWQHIKQHSFIAAGIPVALLILMAFIFFAYRFGWSGTGFLNKTVWDWLQLLIIPSALAIIALVLPLTNARTERQIALDKQRQDLLQTYLDRMSELLLKEQLRSSAEDAEVRDVARARTLTVLPQLDARRKGSLIKILSESKLLGIVDLDDADLSGADLGFINFSGLGLGEANLSDADLGTANLTDADLSDTNLSGAKLWYANLRGAKVTEEQLKTVKSLLGAIMPDGKIYRNSSGVYLSKYNLSGFDLSGVDLSGADLSYANLTDADLSGANLEKASLKDAIGISNEKLEEQAKSLKGAIMPDGSKHP